MKNLPSEIKLLHGRNQSFVERTSHILDSKKEAIENINLQLGLPPLALEVDRQRHFRSYFITGCLFLLFALIVMMAGLRSASSTNPPNSFLIYIAIITSIIIIYYGYVYLKMAYKLSKPFLQFAEEKYSQILQEGQINIGIIKNVNFTLNRGTEIEYLFEDKDNQIITGLYIVKYKGLRLKSEDNVYILSFKGNIILL